MRADVYVGSLGSQELVPANTLPALSTPNFIIREGKDYWVPVALLKYNIDEATNQAETDGCLAVAEKFKDGWADGNVVLAVNLGSDPIRILAVDQATDPPQN
jgi:hypothetical protein